MGESMAGETSPPRNGNSPDRRTEALEIHRQVRPLVGRAKGKRFVALAGEERIHYDLDPSAFDDEDRRHQRKSGHDAA